MCEPLAVEADDRRDLVDSWLSIENRFQAAEVETLEDAVQVGNVKPGRFDSTLKAKLWSIRTDNAVD
jgi:hypothetical protein